MNLSRYIYFESFVNNILKFNKDELKEKMPLLLSEIDFQINKIYRLNTDAYWKITDGDKVFIEQLNLLRDLIKNHNVTDHIKKLLSDTYNLSERCLKIILLLNEVSVWSSFSSLYDSFCNDSRFDVDLVYIPFEHTNSDKNRDHYKIYSEELNLPVHFHLDYNMSKKSPDVVIYIKPYDSIPKEFYITEIEKIVRRTMYICYGFEGSEYVEYQFMLPMLYKLWKYPVFGKCVKEAYKKHGYRNGENCVVWGNPRVDLIRTYMKSRDIPIDWNKKLDGNKVFLWTPHHSIEYGTFVEYKDTIIDFFKKNKNSSLIFRPHPLMIKAIVNNNQISSADLDKFLNDLQDMDNVIYDNNESYKNAFAFSDAIITDGTSFLREYHLLNRPLIHTTKPNGGSQLFQGFVKSHYTVKNSTDLLNYLNMINNGEDPLFKVREDVLKKEIFLPDCGVGEYIKEQIWDNLIKEEQDNALFILNN